MRVRGSWPTDKDIRRTGRWLASFQGVHSPNGGTLPFLPPLPHNRHGYQSGLHCGGEGRGEGLERAMWPPHPHPLPRNASPSESTSIAGERGQETANWRMHLLQTISDRRVDWQQLPTQTSRLPEPEPEKAMQVTLNGTEQSLDDGLTIAQLLVQLGKNPKFLAVERNYELVPRTQHAECLIAEGDTIEIVTLVGGG